MFKKLLVILLTPLLSLAQSPGPITVNGNHVSLNSPTGGDITLNSGAGVKLHGVGELKVKTNNADRWTFGTNGDITQESTTGGDLTLTNANTSVRMPFATGITAAGTDLATATVLTKQISQVTTTAASTGVALPSVGTGSIVYVGNSGANTLAVYAPSGATVDGAASVSIATGKARLFVKVSSTVWFSLAGA